MNRRVAFEWVDLALALAEDYAKLADAYCELQAACFTLIVQLEQEREIRAWARGAIEDRFGNEEKAA